MKRLLELRSFWLALIIGAFSLAAFAACDSDPDEPDGGGGCTQLGAACTPGTTTCCSPLKCQRSPHTNTNICDATISCASNGQRCGPSVPCCGALTCRDVSGTGNSVCYDGTSCASRGMACGSGITCCGALVCRSNVCAD